MKGLPQVPFSLFLETAFNPMFIEERSLDWKSAALIAQAACEYAERQGLKICAYVLDRHGNPLAMQRINHAPSYCTQIAEGKARTASSFGFPTSDWQKRLGEKPHLLNGLSQQPGLVTFGGGIPVKQGDVLLGAIGVSGASEQQDGECAQAGIDALLAAQK